MAQTAVQNSVYSLLCVICDEYEVNLLCNGDNCRNLLYELLASPELHKTCLKGTNRGIYTLYKAIMFMFPLEFKPLTTMMTSITCDEGSAKFVRKLLVFDSNINVLNVVLRFIGLSHALQFKSICNDIH